MATKFPPLLIEPSGADRSAREGQSDADYLINHYGNDHCSDWQF